ncbi:MAG: DNA polymerase Y family protein, partial [Dehalococcoidia bacterium]|nr:DNA polymerase Y family protein [Dehalococcoidia bacterium]
PVVPARILPVLRATLLLDDPLASVDAILFALTQLLTRAFADPAARGRAVRQAHLAATLSDRTSWELLVTFKEATTNASDAMRAIKAKLSLPRALPSAPVERLSLELRGLSREPGHQLALFLDRRERDAPLREAVQRLRVQFGDPAVHRITEVEPWSRIPERRWALTPFDH